MKKQFNRMKQLANQTVGRAEKTEVLSDDLLQIERRMELVRLVSHNAHKRLVTCLQGHIGTDTEKRHKKLPLTALSQAMQDGGSQLGTESLIGKMMDVCGEAESRLASELMQHEVLLERDILEPLNQLAEVDIPNILKQRKQLAKLVLDYDSARARWLQASKSIHFSTNYQATAAKAETLKDEMDEALNKVEMCKDQLSADMYNFSSKEGDYARYYVILVEAQADYHRRSLAALEGVLPTIQAQKDSWMEKPAYGTALEEHLKRSNREIALPLEACVMMLLETGMKEEGLFRIAAGASKLKKLKAALDCSTSQLEEFYSDPHAVAGALKSYLRELPEPLMTFALYAEWTQASNVSDPDKRLQALWVACDGLPKNHKANFRYLVKFLAKLAQDSEVNKMTPSNIAIVLGPNLLWSKTEGTLAEMAAATSVHVVAIIEPIIQHADWFFPDDVDFNVSGMFVATTPEPDPGPFERRRPGSLVDGDSPRKDSPAPNKLGDHTPTPTPRRAATLNRKQHHHASSPAFQPPLPPPEDGGVPQTQPVAEPQNQEQTLGRSMEAGQPGLAVGGGGGGGAPEAQVAPGQQHLLLTQHSAEESSPSHDPTSTPPPLWNGGSQLTVGTPHSQAECRGPSPHIVRRGTKKQAPAPPNRANPFVANASTPGHTPGHSPASNNPYPLVAPRRHTVKETPVHAPSHPPPQPPQAPQSKGESDPSPPHTPTPPSTPPNDGPTSTPLSSFHSGSLPRPTRPAPKPRPRPNVPPPPQPPANDDSNGTCGSASKVITDASLNLKGIDRALIPEITEDRQGETSAGHEPAPSPTPPSDPEIQSESTIL